MKTRLMAILLMTVAVLSLGLLAACGDDNGGGDPLTLEEFLRAVEELDAEFEARTDEIDADFDALGDDPSNDDIGGLLERQSDLLDEFVNGIDGLNAPEEAQDVQSRAVSAGRDVLQIFRDALDQIDDVETLDDFFALFDTPENDAAFDALDQACFDAEALGADNGITVDFSCGE